ncbi:MAG TPA: protein kinase [Kofleriaceae bacterium]
MGADAAEEQFGPYLVYERLGVGGMATVHRALERGIEGFERIVALKRLLPHLAADATFIKSFVREAKLASLLNHVNIVQIFELGRVATQYFISMEYIDGRDVRRILRHARKVSGPPPIHVTVGLLLQLCDALDYAHHKVDDAGHPLGLVHRDVSPSNVLVTSAGQVKVIDFGIAKAQSAQLRTQTGRVKGKLAYMAPEALAGKDLDARSDLFAVGVIAHELMTARPLFASKNEYQTLMKLQRGEVMPPSTFNQSCPPELDAIVLRALARDPDDRFLQSGELRDELHAMRKQYNLQTADRDIASWLEWAFQLPSPQANGGNGHAAPQPAPPAHAPRPPDTERDLRAHARHRPARAPRRTEDDEAVELAWGDHDEHGNGEPIVLDDVPDVSAKHLTHPRALGAEARIDLDDLADDIPTPLPSHGRQGVDLAARTVTTPQRPRNVARSRAMAQVRSSAVVPAQLGVNDRPTVPISEEAAASLVASSLGTPSPAVDDRITEAKAALAVGLHGALVPSRARTITLPPRGVPSSSAAPPRSIAAAALPPRAVPVAGEPSRAVPVPMPASRSAAIAAERSRGVAAAAEPSQGIPAAIEPSHAGPAPAEPSRSVPVALPAQRSGPAAQPPRSLPSGSASPPRARRPTSPGTGTPPLGIAVAPQPPPEVRDAMRDTVPADRAPTFSVEELGLASDTMPSMPAMPSTPSMPASEAVVRFREPTATAVDLAPQTFDPTPPPSSAASPSDTATTEVRSSTRRQRLITPATALFADPDPDLATTTVVSSSTSGTSGAPGGQRPSHSTIRDAPPVPRRVTLGRVLLVVALIAVVGAATAAAALYLTRDEPLADLRPTTALVMNRKIATLRFDVTPRDATISIVGQPPHDGAPWDAELEPGAYQIEIHRTGYQGVLTAVELVAGQTLTVPAALVQLRAAASDATVILDSTPRGLEIIVDGAPRGTTRARLSLTPGHHVFVLRANGADVWSQALDVDPSVIRELHPAIAELVAHPPAGSATAPAPAARPGAAPEPSAPAAEPRPGSAAPPPAGPPAPAPAAPTGAAPAPDVAPAPAAPPAPAPGASAPMSVPGTAVTKIAGAPPRFTPPANVELPQAINTRLCIDDGGHVTAAEVLTPLDAASTQQILAALRAWQYEPYRGRGAAQPVCFPVTFRAK